MWNRWSGRFIRVWCSTFVLSYIVDFAVSLFNKPLGRGLAIWLGFVWLAVSGAVFAVLVIWYLCVCIVGLVRWRLHVRADAMQARQSKES
jgi:hypothetical protein